MSGHGYQAISLWALAGNVRACRFHERAGFSDTGDTLVPDWLGGAAEVRYARTLTPA